MSIISAISTLFAGFSIFAAVILLFAYCFFLHELGKSSHSKIWCAAMLFGLVVLQAFHVAHFLFGWEVLSKQSYNWALLIMPVCFFFFSRAVLFYVEKSNRKDLVHFLPLIVAVWLPLELMPVFAFLVGSSYTLWLVFTVIQMRGQQSRFKFELFFFSLFAAMAALSLLLVAALPLIKPNLYFVIYSNSISLCFLLIVTALLIFPELLSDISEITSSTYQKSQLQSLDITELKSRLETLIVKEQRYADEKLSLSSLAEAMDISSHQLSELINTEYGYGFPRFMKTHRVAAAKQILIEQPQASILSISMETGFRSQSAFYSAFKEIEGVSPGQYRKENF